MAWTLLKIMRGRLAIPALQPRRASFSSFILMRQEYGICAKEMANV